MPLLSIALLVVIIYFLTKRDTYVDRYFNLFMLSSFLRVYWLEGYFIKIGDLEIGNLPVTSEAVLLLYSLYLLWVGIAKLRSRFFYVWLAFLAIVSIGIVYELLMPYDGLLLVEQKGDVSWDGYATGRCGMYTYFPGIRDFTPAFVSLLVWSFNILFFKCVFAKDKFAEMFLRFIPFLKYGVYYGAFEWMVKNIFGNTTLIFNICDFLLGTSLENTGFLENQVRGDFIIAHGLTREASHFNCFLFTVITLSFIGDSVSRKMYGKKMFDNRMVITSVIMLMLSGGFSGVWYLFIAFLGIAVLKIHERQISIVQILRKHMKNTLLFFMAVLSVVLVFIQNEYIYNRFYDAINILDYMMKTSGSLMGIDMVGNSEGMFSTIARLISIYEGTAIFLSRPFWGLGYNLQFVHDTSIFYLMNMGIIGCYAFWKLLSLSKLAAKYDILLLVIIFIIGGYPIAIVPIGPSLHWLLYIEGTAYYMGMKE